MSYILIVYYSKHGTTKELAKYISYGVEQNNMESIIRTVPDIFNNTKKNNEHKYASVNELSKCSGVVLGSPSYFGNMAAPLKNYIDKTSNIWINGDLLNKPAGFFSSSSSMHGGQETTLISMMLPFIHHGSIIVGLPFYKTNLINTKCGGSPYGPTHVNFNKKNNAISTIEKELCIKFGKRISKIAKKLSN